MKSRLASALLLISAIALLVSGALVARGNPAEIPAVSISRAN
jgi:hypothetical protein